MTSLIPYPDALAAVLATARPASSETIALADAPGRILAAPVASPAALPPFDTSAMDGFAVRVSDLATLPAQLPIAATVHAGDALPPPLAAGTAVEIMTGAPLPDGADAVVPVEWAQTDGDTVEAKRAPTPGQYIRRRGGALATGDALLEAGQTVTPATIGLAAAVGLDTLEVAQRPRVAVVSTGDEVRPPGMPLRPGQIWNANGPGLAAQVQAAGARPERHHADDTLASVEAALEAAHAAEVLVVAGGMSMGTRDLVRPALERRGIAWHFWGVAQRPGKPFAFGMLAGCPVFGLPGNPVSAAVGVEVYVRPYLDACLGRSAPPLLVGVLDEAVPKPAGLHTFARVRARRDDSGRLHLRPAGAQASHVARSLLDADGIAHLPAAWTEAPAGAEVLFSPWRW